ncbi:MAG: bacteriocin immunity protein [Clostridium perfringens]|nr:bacteriocin immunity protein [Clostridium perfringens]
MENSEKLTRKEKRELVENNLLARVYDLILNEQTSEEERSILVEFKNAVESGKDFQLETMKLAETLRQLALSKFKHKEKLSDEVSKFYMDISTTGLFEKNLAIEIVCVLINLINLILALKLKNIVVEGEYIIESQEIRKVLVGPIVIFIFLITLILVKQTMIIPLLLVFENFYLISLRCKLYDLEFLSKDRRKYIDINKLIFKDMDSNENSDISMTKEFINIINSNDMVENLDEYKYKYKLTDIQMNYLLESLICEPNSIYTKYNAYIYVNYDLRLLEINSSFKKSNIREFEFRNILMVNEYEILEKIRNINEISEESKLESSVYFLLMNYFKLKEYTTKLDENNYIEYSNNNSKLFDIYFNHLDECINKLSDQSIKISLKAIEAGIPIETISDITGVSLLKLKKFVDDKIDT